MVNSLSVTPDGDYFAAGFADCKVGIFDFSDRLLTLNYHTMGISKVVFSNVFFGLLYCGSNDGVVSVWDLKTEFTNFTETKQLNKKKNSKELKKGDSKEFKKEDSKEFKKGDSKEFKKGDSKELKKGDYKEFKKGDFKELSSPFAVLKFNSKINSLCISKEKDGERLFVADQSNHVSDFLIVQ